jgi:uncharacterized membrane protein YGL010W
MLNALLVSGSVLQTIESGGHVAPTLILSSAFQIFYALDALYNEEYYLQSHVAVNYG